MSDEPKTTAVLGRGTAGKTFVAAHLAMAFSYLGVPTLLVGADQKPDATRAVSPESRPPLMAELERRDFDYRAVRPDQVLVPASQYTDVLELGPSQLLVGHYGGVLDEAFHWFKVHRLLERYRHVIFDVTDERWDSALAPLFRRTATAIAVTEEAVESLFVVNRLLRAVQIGGGELGYPTTLLGVVNNRSLDPHPFDRYAEATNLFPLLTLPEQAELAHLRPFHRTLFGLKSLPRELDLMLDGFVKIADLLRGDPMNVFPVVPLPDEEVWRLAPAVTLPN